MRRKEAVKGLWTVSEERAPGTRYDRFFFEEFAKKIKDTAQIEELIERLKKVVGEAEFVKEVEKIISEHSN